MDMVVMVGAGGGSETVLLVISGLMRSSAQGSSAPFYFTDDVLDNGARTFPILLFNSRHADGDAKEHSSFLTLLQRDLSLFDSSPHTWRKQSS